MLQLDSSDAQIVCCAFRVLDDQTRLGDYSICDVQHVQTELRLRLLGGGCA